jgi:hypothetical protein
LPTITPLEDEYSRPPDRRALPPARRVTRPYLAVVNPGRRTGGRFPESNGDELSVVSGLSPRPTVLEESIRTATYTFDVFSSLDGYGSHSGGDWGGYWGKQGSELLDHRLALYGENQRMVFGANTYRLFAQMLASSTEEPDVGDPWVTRMRRMPATVV